MDFDSSGFTFDIVGGIDGLANEPILMDLVKFLKKKGVEIYLHAINCTVINDSAIFYASGTCVKCGEDSGVLICNDCKKGGEYDDIEQG